MDLPDCEWYNVENIPDIENQEEFISNVIWPFEKHGFEHIAHALHGGEMGDFIEKNEITKPQFEKAVLKLGLANNWSEAQGYWNHIWTYNL